MTIRILAANVLALLLGATALAPVTTVAKSGAGGFLAAPHAPARLATPAPTARPALRTSAPTPTLQHSPTARTVVPAQHGSPHYSPSQYSSPQFGSQQYGAAKSPPGRVHALHQTVRRHRDFRRGFPITILGGLGFYGAYYDPSDDIRYDQPDYPIPVTEKRHVIDVANPDVDEPRRCRAQIQTVHRENGTPYDITIVRC